MKVNKREIMLTILSTECTACESEKRRGACFCEKCYFKLPIETQDKIRNALGRLSEAILSGIKFLEEV